MGTDFLSGTERRGGYLKFRIIHGCVPFSMCHRLVASRTDTLTGGNYRRLRICEYRDAHPRPHPGKLNSISNGAAILEAQQTRATPQAPAAALSVEAGYGSVIPPPKRLPPHD